MQCVRKQKKELEGRGKTGEKIGRGTAAIVTRSNSNLCVGYTGVFGACAVLWIIIATAAATIEQADNYNNNDNYMV